MGLDMYAFATTEIITSNVAEPENATELACWRKHPNLHGWMKRLYESKGGGAVFNCVPVRLESADLDALEQAIKAKALPETAGFFFGASDGSEMEDDLHFVRKARDALAAGLHVYYSSWW